MKKGLIILLIVSLSLSACNWTNRDDTLDDPGIGLTDLLQSYDLWYVDIDQTTGPGNVNFVSKAFTLSFMPDYEVFANNNIAGLGQTGNGYGISIGTYRIYDRDGILSITDDIAGTYDFEVEQIDNYSIRLTNRAANVSYLLTGYQKNEFDYDGVFYDNITYFLQEYEAWTKTDADIVSPSAPFVFENHLRFYVSGNTNVFESSESRPNIPTGQIYWDYSGAYEVLNTSQENRKELLLYYDVNNEQETFILKILDDQNIQLHNMQTDNIYWLTGHGYIQYRPASKRLKKSSKKVSRLTYLKK